MMRRSAPFTLAASSMASFAACLSTPIIAAQKEEARQALRRAAERAGVSDALTPAQQKVVEALMETTKASYDDAVAAALKLDPDVTVEALQDAVRRRMAAESPAAKKAADKRLRKSLKRLKNRK